MRFSKAALTQFRNTQESTMMHECTIEAYTVGEDGTISYRAPVRSVCGFSAVSYAGRGAGEALYETVQADAEMRLPLQTAIGMNDRVTLIRSFDKRLPVPRHFEVCSLPDSFGPSGQVVKLKEVYS